MGSDTGPDSPRRVVTSAAHSSDDEWEALQFDPQVLVKPLLQLNRAHLESQPRIWTGAILLLYVRADSMMRFCPCRFPNGP